MAISKPPPGERVDHADIEEEVTAALARGDRHAALTLLMRCYGEAIYRYAIGMTGDRQLADEARQQVFVDAFRDLDSFAGRSCLRSWLFGIARHRALDAAKGQRRWTQRYKQDAPATTEVLDHDPIHELDRGRLARIVAACLQKLAPAAREAIMLRYQQELPYSEVAALTGERAGTVQQRVARALPVLRRCVDAQLDPGGAK